jgi:hypothetical protein
MIKSLFVNFIASIDSYAAIRLILISLSRRTLDFKNVLVCFFTLVLFLSLSINNIRHSCFRLWFHIKFVSISQWSTVFMYPIETQMICSIYFIFLLSSNARSCECQLFSLAYIVLILLFFFSFSYGMFSRFASDSIRERTQFVPTSTYESLKKKTE